MVNMCEKLKKRQSRGGYDKGGLGWCEEMAGGLREELGKDR